MLQNAGEPASGKDGVAHDGLSIAVVIPCLDEEASVASVVAGFRTALPSADVYVYDNGSSDGTARVAQEAGATVRRESRPGKGNVVRRMFADIDADVYVMVDGDGTYDASTSRRMVDLLVQESLDMVVGRRVPVQVSDVYRPGHTTGNRLFSTALRLAFGGSFTDVFSGYRVLSRRLVKTFPVSSTGFEIETELTAHALDLASPVAEVDTAYGARVEGSGSKLRTYRDGWRISRTMVRLFRTRSPAAFFGVLSLLLTTVALALGVPLVATFVESGEVPRFPTAILAAAVQTVAIICATSGVILGAVARLRRETKQLHYLSLPHLQPTRSSLLPTGRIGD